LVILAFCAVLGVEIYSVCQEDVEFDISNEELEKIDSTIDFENIILNASELGDGMLVSYSFLLKKD